MRSTIVLIYVIYMLMRLRQYATKSLTFYEFVYNKQLLCLKWLPLCKSTDQTPVAQTIVINYYKKIICTIHLKDLHCFGGTNRFDH